MGLGVPEELLRKANSQPTMIRADLHPLQEPVVGRVDRALNKILSRAWLYRDRSAAEVVYDDVSDALVE